MKNHQSDQCIELSGKGLWLHVVLKRFTPALLRRVVLNALMLLVLAACARVDVAQPDLTAPSSTPATADNNDIIRLHYNERPPYLMTTDTGVGGLTGDPATMVFEASDIPYQWHQTPSKRQIYILQQNAGRDCLPGWFKTEERETFARYTRPIYQDRPQFALARADNDALPSAGTVDEVFANSQLTLLVKDGYSYGSFLDQKIEALNPVRLETTIENSGMLKMVYAGHADYFFIAPEEAEGLIKASAFDFQDFKTVNFTDIPGGEMRYILCSFQVQETIIEQLDRIIQKNIVIYP